MLLNSKHSPPGKLSWDELFNALQWAVITALLGLLNYAADYFVPVLAEASGWKAILLTVAIPIMRGLYWKMSDTTPMYQ